MDTWGSASTNKAEMQQWHLLGCCDLKTKKEMNKKKERITFTTKSLIYYSTIMMRRRQRHG
jgi:hypothetical protein